MLSGRPLALPSLPDISLPESDDLHLHFVDQEARPTASEKCRAPAVPAWLAGRQNALHGGTCIRREKTCADAYESTY